MRHFKLLIFSVLLCFGFTACASEEIPHYNLNIISPAFERVYNHYKGNESDTEKYVLDSANNYTEIITEENAEFIKSITVCDDSISKESAQEIINIANEENIPVFFMMNDIDKDIIASYDKAFCISSDYTYIGELFATYINNIWLTDIVDRDNDQIFSFSVIKPETMSDIQQLFYDSLIKNIELLGIPLHQVEELFLSKGDVLSYCEEHKTENEAYIILDSHYLNLFPEEYSPVGDGVEIIGIDFAHENNYAESPFMKVCLIDYNEYFNARDIILKNIEDKVYPFENLELNVIDKNIYIKPTI